MEVRSDRRYQFDVAPDELWPALTRVDAYQQWWPWLRTFDGVKFGVGERWACVVQPPLPYHLRFTIELEEVVEARYARAVVDGDITGLAYLDVLALDGGSELRLSSRLAPASSMLRAIARVAMPVAQLGHDWVIDTGLKQFRAKAL